MANTPPYTEFEVLRNYHIRNIIKRFVSPSYTLQGIIKMLYDPFNEYESKANFLRKFFNQWEIPLIANPDYDMFERTEIGRLEAISFLKSQIKVF